MGMDIVSRLLERGARVLYKPHPATGQRLKEATRVSDEIAERLQSAGGGSRVVEPTPGSLYDAFNEADVVVTDVSSVISDFLASRKPLVVTNPTRVPETEFSTMFPSTRACYVMDEPAGLDVALDDIVTADSMREQRERYARYLLGERRGDPFVRFLDEVDGFVGRADQELERRERARAEFEGSSPWLAQ
jgi:CDP-glycerol glycerophosphotransferase (TagB/SpsB family)